MINNPDKFFLSLIIPVYKQDKTIIQNLRSIKKSLDNTRYKYEIIVVIDGILDASYKRINKAKMSKVKILAYSKNQGKWYAIKLGMKHAKGDYVMFMDAGMEIDPNGISMLLEHMIWYEADIIVGSKRHPASYINYSPLRKILSYGYYYLVKILFGVKVRDTQAGIKVFRKSLLKKILPRQLEKRFSGDLEMLVIANKLGYKRIYEAPIKLDYELGPLTSAANIRSIWRMFMDTLAIYYRAYILKLYEKPHKKFRTPRDLKIHSW